MDASFIVLSAFAIFFIISIAVLIALWIALPFSVFGVKDLLKKAIEEQEKTNRLLKSILDAGLLGAKAEFPRETDKTNNPEP